MKVHIAENLSSITISTNPGFFDPLKFKIMARHLSFRTVLLLVLLASFCLPFTFILVALKSLENVEGCRSSDCLYFGRKGGQTSRKSLPEVQVEEETLRVAQMQRALYRHFASKGIPKGLHCLSLILTIEHSTNPAAQKSIEDPILRQRFTDPSLRHFVLITDNVLAASVVVNSAVRNSEVPESFVFHLVTERMSFPAMKAWFALNPPSPAVLEVLGVHQFKWIDRDSLPVLEIMETSEGLRRHYFGDHSLTDSTNETPGSFTAKLAARNPKYVSIMNHLRMYLPQIFPRLSKVVFLDDDVVVQKDLSSLWEIPLGGKVMGAVETCHGSDRVMSKRFKTYLNFSHPLIAHNFDPEKCAWAYGMNILDLVQWRKSNVTNIYNYWQRRNMLENLALWRLGTLPPSLIAFDGQLQAIDSSWHMLGLGYFQDSKLESIKQAAIIHFNGAAKPWLDLAIPEFRPFWSKYVNYSNTFLRQCNIYDL